MEKVIGCLAEYLGIEEDKINKDSKLVEELGLSSFDLVNLTCEMEEKFHISISPKDLINIKTVCELNDLISSKIENTKY